jgi:hypothetical protein
VTVDETIQAIERLRAMGAQRVRVADIEVDFGAVPKHAVAAEPAPRVTPEEAQRRAREDDEKVIFAASG